MHKVTILLFILSMLAVPASPAAAQTCSNLTWGETRTASFIFSYQASLPLGAEIAQSFGNTLDEEFFRFASLFETSLPVPITVRLYPNERDYYCFNALAPRIPIGTTHSHIGSREIALIAANIQADPDEWAQTGLNVLRHELAVLFTLQRSGDHAPPGLLHGIGGYAQDPFQTFELRFNKAPPPLDRPSTSWRALWENPDWIANPDLDLQATSLTAFLIDVYGWDRFLTFLSTLRTADSWRLALEEVYPAGHNALETQWAEKYYPIYMQGRWRQNALYALSLTPYEQLIQAGAYQAASDGLATVISLLVDLEDYDRLNQAQHLNVLAQSGLQADALARQARQAYLEGDFQAAEDFSAQALDLYASLEDTRNTQTLETIRTQAQEVIELREQLTGIQNSLTAFGATFQGSQLAAIGQRLQALGDAAGAAQAEDAILQLNMLRLRMAAGIAALGIILSLTLLTGRIRAFKRPTPPEARLHH